MADQKAINTVRYLKIAEPCIANLKAEKTLNVAGENPAFNDWPPVLVAKYCLRTALENGCTRITVHQGALRKTDFDVIQLVKWTRSQNSGYLPTSPHMLPSNLATAHMLNMGAELGVTKPHAAVSVDLTAAKESPNVLA